ncbi:MAG: TIGR01777 family oxidoreductase [Gemmatimonadaceae bacterium]
MRRSVFRSTFPVPAEELFAWHERPGAFERLNPPWAPARVIERTGGIRSGDRVRLRVPTGPLHTTWLLEHRDYVEGRQFRDVLLSGPFSHWEHTHTVTAQGASASTLEDSLAYAFPLEPASRIVAGRYTQTMLTRLFRHRHVVLATDLERHALYAGHPRLRIVVSGASGFIGSALTAFLTSGGHTVRRLVRAAPRGTDIGWDPERGFLDPAALEGVDAVIHLAGEPIAQRWTGDARRRIRDSRLSSTRLLARTLAGLDAKPMVFLSASAIGYYGADRAEEVLVEESAAGADFLGKLTREWEHSADPAAQAGIRVAHPRTGIVLGPNGGALAKILPPFRLGLGGRLGSGQQWMSWISLEDAIGALHFALMTESVRGPFNVVAPTTVRNEEFTRVLAGVLGRPALATVPAFAIKLALGEMGIATALGSAHVVPRALDQAGFRFRFPNLEGALRFELGR